MVALTSALVDVSDEGSRIDKVTTICFRKMPTRSHTARPIDCQHRPGSKLTYHHINATLSI